MEGVLRVLLESGPVYVVLAVVLSLLIWDRKQHREERRLHREERESLLAKYDALARKLYEVSMTSIAKDEEVRVVLERVRDDVAEVRAVTVLRPSGRT